MSAMDRGWCEEKFKTENDDHCYDNGNNPQPMFNFVSVKSEALSDNLHSELIIKSETETSEACDESLMSPSVSRKNTENVQCTCENGYTNRLNIWSQRRLVECQLCYTTGFYKTRLGPMIKCHICQGTIDLRNHFIDSHNTEKYLPCCHCGVRLFSKKGVILHQRLHQAVYLYHCNDCNSHYKTLDDVNIKIRDFCLKCVPLFNLICSSPCEPSDSNTLTSPEINPDVVVKEESEEADDEVHRNSSNLDFEFVSVAESTVTVRTYAKSRSSISSALYTCPLCSATSRDIVAKRTHMLAAHYDVSARPLRCNCCEVDLKTMKAALSHHRLHRTTFIHRCRRCKASFKTMQDVTTNMLQSYCIHCLPLFALSQRVLPINVSAADNLASNSTHSSSLDIDYTPPINILDIVQHAVTFSFSDETSDSAVPCKIRKDKKILNFPCLTCKMCDQACESSWGLHLHKQGCSVLLKSKEMPVTSESKGSNDGKSETSKKVYMTPRNKRRLLYNQKMAAQRAKRVLLGEPTNLVCSSDSCYEMFPMVDELIEHSKSCHPTLRLRYCPICSERFSSISNTTFITHLLLHKKAFVQLASM